MPALAQVLVFVAQQLLKHAPALFAQIVAVFAKKDVTVEELEKLRAEIAAQKYEDFVPDTQLPKDQP